MTSPIKFIIKLSIFLLSILVTTRAGMEFYANAPVSGEILGKFSPVWAFAFVGWLSYSLLLMVWIGSTLFSKKWSDQVNRRLISFRQKSSGFRWLAIGAFVLLPTLFLLFTRWGQYFQTSALRTIILITSGLGTAIYLNHRTDQLLNSFNLGLGFLLSASVFYIGMNSVYVTNFPFALSWSEGNRLYDYSIILGKDRYIYPGILSPVRKEAGRYLLWGLPFLIRNSPIWLHRFWNMILGTLPALLFGYLMTRWGKLPRSRNLALSLWVFLFLAQGPIYTPLILSAILVVLFVCPGRWISAGIATIVASYYASSSRFTWLPAVPAFAGFILLTDLDLPEFLSFKPWGLFSHWLLKLLKKLIPLIIIVGLGLASGALANPLLFSPRDLSESMVFAQPLLWYRLLPNSTYREGIILALLLACGPLILLLVGLAVKKDWKLNWLQRIMYPFSLLVFLGGGLVASVKIGGGSNLHNLDMFMVSLAILSGLALSALTPSSASRWSAYRLVLIGLTVLIPAWSAYQGGGPLQLPGENQVRQALEVIQTRADEASQQGEVLFMDQRQLLTFDYIHGITLVPDYEKKYVMDQAMANNVSYFRDFYQDLSDQRFSMIVTNPMFTKIKESDFRFAEENNAWVRWVAEPVMCFYKPVRKIPGDVLEAFNIQLLVPRPDISACQTSIP